MVEALANSNIYEAALKSLMAIVPTIAQQKNVRVLPDAYEPVAERALDFMELSAIYDFMALRPGAGAMAAHALNRSLDLYVAMSLYACIGQLDQRLDFTPQAIEALGEEFVGKLLPRDVAFYRWPDLSEMVARHYADSPKEPKAGNRRARADQRSRSCKRPAARTDTP